MIDSLKLRFTTGKEEEYSEWKRIELGDAVSVTMGQSPDSSAYNEVGEGKPLVQGNADMRHRTTCPSRFTRQVTKVARTGDIVMSVRAPVGIVGIADREVCCGRGIASLCVKEEYDHKFIYQLLQKLEPTWTSIAQGGIFSAVSANDIRARKVVVPSLPEQRKIAEFFGAIDEVIELQRSEVEAWELRKRAMMQKLFSQSLRFKSDNNTPYPSWQQKPLGEDICFINGRAYAQDELLHEGKYRVLRVGNLFTNDSYYYSDFELDGSKYIEDGDLIYAWSATFGPRIYRGEKCIFHYHIWKLIFDESSIFKEFLNQLLLNDVERIKSQQAGGTMSHVTKSVMEKRQLLFPSFSEQKKIAECLSLLDEVVVKEKAELGKWEELKRGLLQRMFV